ncbi:MAG: glycosyltransferase [Acidimicrobiales bacterium]
MISIVMPAHNEAGWIEPAVTAVVSGARDRGIDFEVVIAENGSSDTTAAESEALAGCYPEVHVIRSRAADYGQALRDGFLATRGEIVVNFDVDLVDLGFLDRALGAMADPHVAVVVGSKRSPGANDRRNAARKAVTAVFSVVMRYGFGLGVSDTHGLKALRREPLEAVVAASRLGADIFDTEIVLRAERAGLTVVEIPVAVVDQRPPRTPIARRIPRSLMGLAQLRLVLWREDS